MRSSRPQLGFTLIETLVALTILTLSVTGAFVAVQSGLSAATLSQDDVTAFYLAGEAVEQIRNMRDTNGLAGVNWLTGIAANPSDPCFQGNTCTVDVLSSTGQPLAACPDPINASSCPPLDQDQSQPPPPDVNYGLYGYNTDWTPSRFTRTVQITALNTHEIAIQVKVAWQRGLLPETFIVHENLFDWQS